MMIAMGLPVVFDTTSNKQGELNVHHCASLCIVTAHLNTRKVQIY